MTDKPKLVVGERTERTWIATLECGTVNIKAIKTTADNRWIEVGIGNKEAPYTTGMIHFNSEESAFLVDALAEATRWLND